MAPARTNFLRRPLGDRTPGRDRPALDGLPDNRRVTDAARDRPASLALPFLRLGTVAFGGPAAHVAMMEEEFVRRRAWLTRQELLDLVGAAGLLPGPSSTEVALFIGYRRAGFAGLAVAGCCFVLPAALMVTAIAWGYVAFGALPRVGAALQGIKAVVLAIVVQAAFAFGKTALKSGRPGEVYNAVDDEPVTQLSFFQWLSGPLGKELPPSAPEDAEAVRKRGVTNKKVSNRRLKMELGYQYQYPTFRQGYTAELIRRDRAGE